MVDTIPQSRLGYRTIIDNGKLVNVANNQSSLLPSGRAYVPTVGGSGGTIIGLSNTAAEAQEKLDELKRQQAQQAAALAEANRLRDFRTASVIQKNQIQTNKIIQLERARLNSLNAASDVNNRSRDLSGYQSKLMSIAELQKNLNTTTQSPKLFGLNVTPYWKNWFDTYSGGQLTSKKLDTLQSALNSRINNYNLKYSGQSLSPSVYAQAQKEYNFINSAQNALDVARQEGTNKINNLFAKAGKNKYIGNKIVDSAKVGALTALANFGIAAYELPGNVIDLGKSIIRNDQLTTPIGTQIYNQLKDTVKRDIELIKINPTAGVARATTQLGLQYLTFKVTDKGIQFTGKIAKKVASKLEDAFSKVRRIGKDVSLEDLKPSLKVTIKGQGELPLVSKSIDINLERKLDSTATKLLNAAKEKSNLDLSSFEEKTLKNAIKNKLRNILELKKYGSTLNNRRISEINSYLKKAARDAEKGKVINLRELSTARRLSNLRNASEKISKELQNRYGVKLNPVDEVRFRKAIETRLQEKVGSQSVKPSDIRVIKESEGIKTRLKNLFKTKSIPKITKTLDLKSLESQYIKELKLTQASKKIASMLEDKYKRTLPQFEKQKLVTAIKKELKSKLETQLKSLDSNRIKGIKISLQTLRNKISPLNKIKNFFTSYSRKIVKVISRKPQALNVINIKNLQKKSILNSKINEASKKLSDAIQRVKGVKLNPYESNRLQTQLKKNIQNRLSKNEKIIKIEIPAQRAKATSRSPLEIKIQKIKLTPGQKRLRAKIEKSVLKVIVDKNKNGSLRVSRLRPFKEVKGSSQVLLMRPKQKTLTLKSKSKVKRYTLKRSSGKLRTRKVSRIKKRQSSKYSLRKKGRRNISKLQKRRRIRGGLTRFSKKRISRNRIRQLSKQKSNNISRSRNLNLKGSLSKNKPIPRKGTLQGRTTLKRGKGKSISASQLKKKYSLKKNGNQDQNLKVLSKPAKIFKVLVRKRGKVIVLKDRLTERDALNYMAYELDNQLLRTARIKPMGSSKVVRRLSSKYDRAFEKRKKKFRQYMIRKKKKLPIRGFIEKSKYALDTIEERTQLKRLSKKGRTVWLKDNRAKLKRRSSKRRSQRKLRRKRISFIKRRSVRKVRRRSSRRIILRKPQKKRRVPQRKSRSVQRPRRKKRRITSFQRRELLRRLKKARSVRMKNLRRKKRR